MLVFDFYVYKLLKQNIECAFLNISSVEAVKTHSLPKAEIKKWINVYDMGIIANIWFFFDTRLFLFWWPMENHQFDDGISL